MKKAIYRLFWFTVVVIICILIQDVDRAVIINAKAAIGIVLLLILIVLKLGDLKKRRKNKLSKSD